MSLYNMEYFWRIYLDIFIIKKCESPIIFRIYLKQVLCVHMRVCMYIMLEQGVPKPFIIRH